MKTYFQNHVLVLRYDVEKELACATWNGFLSKQEFQEATTTCAKLLEEENITRWLADNRKMKAIRQADQEWFMANIWPRMVNSRLRRMATLVSEDLFNKMAVEQMVQRADHLGDIVLKDFEDEAAALAWLNSPNFIETQGA
ncbi:MAG: STAS/SEC14 domain-containing protein [Rufibacter sp.]